MPGATGENLTHWYVRRPRNHRARGGFSVVGIRVSVTELGLEHVLEAFGETTRQLRFARAAASMVAS